MEEKYFLKQRMKTGMGNILNSGARSDKVSSDQF
jgi:hypothetical protein